MDDRTTNRFPLDLFLRNPITQILLMRLFSSVELFISLKLIPEILSMLYFTLYFRAQSKVLLGENVDINQTTKYVIIAIFECLSRIVTYTIFFAICKNIFPLIFLLLVELLIMCIDVDRFVSISLNNVSSANVYDELYPMFVYTHERINSVHMKKIKID